MHLKQEMENLEHGTRIGCIHRDKEEQISVLVPYLVAGLKKNEKCFGIISDETREQLLNSLLSLGVDVSKCNAWGQFAFSSPEEAYLKEGEFDPEDLLDFLKKAETEAILDGFDGLRLAGEAKGLYGKIIAIDRFFEYGLKKNEFIRRSRTIVFTQYEEDSFPEEFLRNALYTYPMIILRGKLCDNKHYSGVGFASPSDEKDILSYEQLKEELLRGG